MELLLSYLFSNIQFKPKVSPHIQDNKTKTESSAFHSMWMQSSSVAVSLRHFHYWEK